MKRMLAKIQDVATRLYRDERGAEGLEKLLIIGAIVLPLLAILILFRNDISEWLSDKYDTVKDDADSDPNVSFGP